MSLSARPTVLGRHVSLRVRSRTQITLALRDCIVLISVNAVLHGTSEEVDVRQGQKHSVVCCYLYRFDGLFLYCILSLFSSAVTFVMSCHNEYLCRAAYAVVRCPSVCLPVRLSVTFVYSVDMNKHNLQYFRVATPL